MSSFCDLLLWEKIENGTKKFETRHIFITIFDLPDNSYKQNDMEIRCCGVIWDIKSSEKGE